jgi:WD40 repeat protein
MSRRPHLLSAALSGAFLQLLLLPGTGNAAVSYEQQIYPILKDNCIACHNKTTTKAGLNMETPELMMKGGESDKGILPGKGADSIIYQAAAHTWDSDMPPKGNKVGAKNLSPEELTLLKQWIDEGAKHSGKTERVYVWQPLPPALKAIYAVAVTADGHFAAAARANQVSIYHLPTRSLATRLTDDALLKSGLYKQSGVAHRDVVQSIAFSPDGNHLATGSFREVKLWKRPVTALKPIAAAPSVAAQKFSLKAGQPNIVSLINNTDGKSLRDINHGAAITASSISPDDQRIATTGADHRIKIWELATGKIITEIKGNLAAEGDLAERARAVSAATLETVWQKEAITRAQKDVTDLDARLKKANELAELAKKSLEDKRKDAKTKTDAKTAADKEAKEVADLLAKVPADKPDEALKKKDTDAREKATKAATEAMLASEALTRAEAAITDTTNEIRLVNESAAKAKKAVADAQAAQGLAAKALEAANAARSAATTAQANALPALTALAFSPTGDQIAGLAADGTVHVWSTSTATPISATASTIAGRVTALQWPSPEGWIVAGDKGTFLCPDLTHSAWTLERNLGSGDGKSPITDRANSLCFSPDGKTLAVGSGEPSRSGDVTFWDVASGKLTRELPEIHIDSILSLDFSPDSKLLATGGADKAVRITDLSTGKVIKTFEGHTHHVLGIAWRADGRILSSAGADNAVKIWDWTLGDRRKNVDGWDKEVTAIHYLGASDTAATSAGDAKIRLINSDGGEVKQLPGSKAFMNTLSSSRDGDLIAAGGQDGVLRLWQVSTGKEVGTFE